MSLMIDPQLRCRGDNPLQQHCVPAISAWKKVNEAQKGGELDSNCSVTFLSAKLPPQRHNSYVPGRTFRCRPGSRTSAAFEKYTPMVSVDKLRSSDSWRAGRLPVDRAVGSRSNRYTAPTQTMPSHLRPLCRAATQNLPVRKPPRSGCRPGVVAVFTLGLAEV